MALVANGANSDTDQLRSPQNATNLTNLQASPSGNDSEPILSLARSVNSASNQSRKQKRRKPTLNCSECVSRKTKCDRGRPSCLACVRRRAACHYSHVANVLVSSRWHPSDTRPEQSNGLSTNPLRLGVTNRFGEFPAVQPDYRALESTLRLSLTRAQDSPLPSASRINRHNENSAGRLASLSMFGAGSRHPFNNYWTNSGGIPEVVGVLPSKDQADLLVEKYFEAVDPIYPILDEDDFRSEYERFWSLSHDDKNRYDAADLALHFIIYACGTRLVDILTPDERVNTSQFYLSACHQCMCIHSYLNCFALTTIKTAVIICHFLIAENNVSDAWTFSGMTQRQAYGLELHRDPDLVTPLSTRAQKQERSKIWLCCMFQDSSLSMFLSLPPTTTHYDISPDFLYLNNDVEDQPGQEHGNFDVVSPQSAQKISSAHDSSYLGALWDFVAFLQSYVCINRALDRPMSDSPEHKHSLISKFRQVYDSWPEPFNSYDPSRYEISDKRLLRQVIAVSSSYFYVLTTLCMDRDESSGVEWDVYGALDAAHEGMAAFFALQRLDPQTCDAWGAYHTRAFSQAKMIGMLLSAQPKLNRTERDVRLMLAKSDFDRYLDILIRGHGSKEYEAIQVMRIADLQAIRANITAV